MKIRLTRERPAGLKPAVKTTVPSLVNLTALSARFSSAARAGNKGIKAEIAFASDLPAMVAGDALRLRAALENLVDNAVKFTSEGTVVLSLIHI